MTDTDSAAREANKQTLRRAIAAIGALDLDAVVSELHDEIRCELPYEEAVPDSGVDGIRTLQVMCTGTGDLANSFAAFRDERAARWNPL